MPEPIRFPLFKNDHKAEGSKQPDYKYKNEEEGIDAAAWLRKSKTGRNYLSVSVTITPPAVAERAEPPGAAPLPVAGDEIVGDDIPF